MDYRIFKPAHRCECMWLHTGGCTDTVRWSALEVDSGKKIPCRSGESNLPQWCAGLTPYLPSYIPSWLAVTLDCKSSGETLTPGQGRMRHFQFFPSQYLHRLVSTFLIFMCTACTKICSHWKKEKSLAAT